MNIKFTSKFSRSRSIAEALLLINVNLCPTEVVQYCVVYVVVELTTKSVFKSIIIICMSFNFSYQ